MYIINKSILNYVSCFRFSVLFMKYFILLLIRSVLYIYQNIWRNEFYIWFQNIASLRFWRWFQTCLLVTDLVISWNIYLLPTCCHEQRNSRFSYNTLRKSSNMKEWTPFFFVCHLVHASRCVISLYFMDTNQMTIRVGDISKLNTIYDYVIILRCIRWIACLSFHSWY